MMGTIIGIYWVIKPSVFKENCIMTNSKTNKSAQAVVTPKVAVQSLTYISGKSRAEHNIKRAKAVNGFTIEKALAHYGTLYPKGAQSHLNYDLKIGSLVLK